MRRTLKIKMLIKLLLSDSEIATSDVLLDKIFQEDQSAVLSLAERKKRFVVIRKAKTKAEKQLEYLGAAYYEAMHDVADHGGTLR